MFGEELLCTRPGGLSLLRTARGTKATAAGAIAKAKKCGSLTCSHSEGSRNWRVWGISKGQPGDCTWPRDAAPQCSSL